MTSKKQTTRPVRASKVKQVQVFDCQDMPQKLCSRMLKEYIDNGKGNSSWVKLSVDERIVDDPELYEWLIKSGYNKDDNPPYGDPLLLLHW